MNAVITSDLKSISITYNDTFPATSKYEKIEIAINDIASIRLLQSKGVLELWINNGEILNFSFDNPTVPIVDSINGVPVIGISNLNTSMCALNKVGNQTVSDFVQITVNTAVLASAANLRRRYWSVTLTKKDAYIRFLPASTDGSTRKGIFLKKDQLYEMPQNDIYPGEISIINNKNGDKPEYSITTY